MAKKQEKPWQYKFSFALSLVMLALVLGYFVQSFLEISKVQPVRVAVGALANRAPGCQRLPWRLRRPKPMRKGPPEAIRRKICLEIESVAVGARPAGSYN